MKGEVYYKLNGKLMKDNKGNVHSDTFTNKTIKIPENIPGDNIKIDIDPINSEELLTDDLDVTMQVMTTTVISRPGENIRVIALLSDEYNKVINDKNVQFKLNGNWVLDYDKKPMKIPVVNGLVTFDYKLPYKLKPGDYDLTMVFDEKGYKFTNAYIGLVLDKLHTYMFCEPIFIDYGEPTAEVEAIIRDELDNTLAYPVTVDLSLAGENIKKVKAINGIVHTEIEIPNVTGILTLTLLLSETDVYYESEFTTTISIGY